jgi:hypothetical protein
MRAYFLRHIDADMRQKAASILAVVGLGIIFIILLLITP